MRRLDCAMTMTHTVHFKEVNRSRIMSSACEEIICIPRHIPYSDSKTCFKDSF